MENTLGKVLGNKVFIDEEIRSSLVGEGRWYGDMAFNIPGERNGDLSLRL